MESNSATMEAYNDENELYEYEQVYRQSLTTHHIYRQRDFGEQQFYRRPQQQTEGEDVLSRFFSLFASKGVIMAMAIAIAVVMLTHYQDDLRAWYAYYFPRGVSKTDSLRILALQSIQSLYGWIQYLSSGILWEKVLDWTRRARQSSPQPVTRYMTRNTTDAFSGADDLPEMELVPVVDHSIIMAPDLEPKGSADRLRARMNTTELEPTFLRESDYPPGWAVYHRILGVVRKTEADEYDERIIYQENHEEEEKRELNTDFDEEKKDELSSAVEIDEEKTVHHSNKSTNREKEIAENAEDSSSSSDNGQSSSVYPILHSITAGG